MTDNDKRVYQLILSLRDNERITYKRIGDLLGIGWRTVARSVERLRHDAEVKARGHTIGASKSKPFGAYIDRTNRTSKSLRNLGVKHFRNASGAEVRPQQPEFQFQEVS